jgi:hypothetical protein
VFFLEFNFDGSFLTANSLNGRFFAGRMITVTFWNLLLYYTIIQNENLY